MKIYLASANIDEIEWATGRRLIDGVLTTHGLLRGDDPEVERAQMIDICGATQGPVLLTAHALTATEVYRDARDLAKLSDRVIVQVPFIEDAFEAIHRLTAEGVPVAATLVVSVAQALLAERAGAIAVVVPIDELAVAGHDAIAVLRELRAAFSASGSEADIIALRPTNAAEFAACATAGVEAVAVAPNVLRALLLHPLTDRGVDRFLQDLSKRHVSWSVV